MGAVSEKCPRSASRTVPCGGQQQIHGKSPLSPPQLHAMMDALRAQGKLA